MNLNEIIQEQLNHYGVTDDVDLKLRCFEQAQSNLAKCDFDKDPKSFFVILSRSYIIRDLVRKRRALKTSIIS